MEGGALLISNTYNSYNLFIDNIESLKYMQTNSIGGHLFKGTMKHSGLSLWGGREEFATKTKSFILKLLNIHPTSRALINNKEVIHKDTFKNEVQKQQEIFRKSMDFSFEPICPSVILSNTRTRDEITTDFAAVTYPDGGRTINDIVQASVAALNGVKFGIIIMEIVENFRIAADYFPNIRDGLHHYNDFCGPQISAQTSGIRKKILLNFAVQIIRLMAYGYRHGDPHLYNALVFQNYDYIENYRVVLIDFGRTEEVSPPDYSLNVLITPGTFWSHTIIKEYLTRKNLTTPETYAAFAANIIDTYFKPKMTRFVKKLYKGRILGHLQSLVDGVGVFFSLVTGGPPIQLILNTDEHELINHVISSYAPTMPPGDVMISTNIACPDSNVKAKQYSLNQSIAYAHAQNVTTDSIYSDSLKHLVPNARKPKLFTYVIGFVNGENPPKCKIFTARVYNCLEYGTKHLAIMRNFNIERFFGAGELIIEDRNIRMNFASGTFMGPVVAAETSAQICLRLAMCKRIIANHLYGTPFNVDVVANTAQITANKLAVAAGFFSHAFCCDARFNRRVQEEARILQFDPTLRSSVGGGLVKSTLHSENTNLKTILMNYKMEEIPEQYKYFISDWIWGIENGVTVKPVYESKNDENFKKLLNSKKYNTSETNVDFFLKSLNILDKYVNMIKYNDKTTSIRNKTIRSSRDRKSTSTKSKNSFHVFTSKTSKRRSSKRYSGLHTRSRSIPINVTLAQ